VSLPAFGKRLDYLPAITEALTSFSHIARIAIRTRVSPWPSGGAMMVPMSDALGVTWVVVSAAMFAAALLYGYARPGEKHAVRYLYASYAALVVAFGSMAVALALLGPVRDGVFAAAVLAVTLPIMLVRDKRRRELKGVLPAPLAALLGAQR
jgi:hypothetical protein